MGEASAESRTLIDWTAVPPAERCTGEGEGALARSAGEDHPHLRPTCTNRPVSPRIVQRSELVGQRCSSWSFYLWAGTGPAVGSALLGDRSHPSPLRHRPATVVIQHGGETADLLLSHLLDVERKPLGVVASALGIVATDQPEVLTH
jgi:hypothetical protein